MDNTTKPLISVLMPVYNTRAYLREALDSVLGQTYQNLDIVLLDDGSTDGSAEICDEYAARDGRVRVIHQPNSGVTPARNRLLTEMRGEYIAWVDSDDVCAPDMLAYLCEGITAYDADIAQVQNTENAAALAKTGTYDIHDARVRLLDTQDAIGEAFETRAINEWVTLKLFRRALLEGVVVPELSYGEDDYLIHIVCMQTPRVLLLPATMYYYRQHRNSLIHMLTPQQLSAYAHTVKPWPARKFSLHACYLEAHILAISLYRHKCRDMTDDAYVTETFRRAREHRDALRASGYLGILGKIELSALATGRPWSWRFAALCQRLYELRSKLRRNQ